MSAQFSRTRQCSACPWKKSTSPHRDIPGGYDPKKHAALASCDGSFGARPMACHETDPGQEQACVGWMAWAIGPGNSIPLRMRAISGEIKPGEWVLDGPQHESLAAMCATATKRRRRRA